MAQSKASIQKKLDRALDSGHLVAIHHPGVWNGSGQPTNCFVVMRSKKWLVVNIVDINCWAVDGFECVRVSDITKVKDLGNYARGPLRHFGATRQAPPSGLDLSTKSSLLTSASSLFPIIGIEQRRVRPDAMWFGRLIRIEGSSAIFHEITPKRRWKSSESKFKLDNISAIHFGNRYEQALDLFQIEGLI